MPVLTYIKMVRLAGIGSFHGLVGLRDIQPCRFLRAAPGSCSCVQWCTRLGSNRWAPLPSIEQRFGRCPPARLRLTEMGPSPPIRRHKGSRLRKPQARGRAQERPLDGSGVSDDGLAGSTMALTITGARLLGRAPVFFGALDWGRTSDLCLRRAALYPTELRVQWRFYHRAKPCTVQLGFISR